MICPKCKREVNGKWCGYCGTQLEVIDTAVDYEFDNQQTMKISPITYEVQPVEEKYRDDVFDPDAAADSEYYNTDKELGSYAYADAPKNNKTKLIVILSVCAVLVVIAVAVLIGLVFSGNGDKDDAGSDAKPVQTEQAEAESIFKTAEKYMTIGDYEAAEESYLQLTELTDDDEALLLYNVVYNYNRALKKCEASDYEAAKKHFDKIPVEYVDYVISSDVDDLGDDIDMGISAYETFDNIKKYMDDEDYEAARQEMDILEEKYLSKTDKEKLDEYAQELDKIEEEAEKKREEEEAKYALTSHEAESLIMEYCDAMVNAINNSDFSLVSPYIDSQSELYETQRGLVNYCASEGITESFDSLRIKKFTKIDGKTWEAQVSETETIYYDNGTQETKTYSWTYTIKYIDSDYYITGLR